MHKFHNKTSYSNNLKGFTLVELIVVITIIGILATVGVGSYSNVLKTARDTKRKSDLRDIKTALDLYYFKHGTYRVDGGAGYSDPKCGCGWLSRVDGVYYRKSVTQALYDEGLIGVTQVEDPLAAPSYMIYICEGGQVYSISATLENPTVPETDFAENHTCNGNGSNGTVTRYGKNYAVTNKAY